MAELLRPLSSAFTELWLDGEKAATVEWRDEAEKAMPGGVDVDTEMVKDNGRGIVLNHPVEPLYGDIYMPREYSFLSVTSVFARLRLPSGYCKRVIGSCELRCLGVWVEGGVGVGRRRRSAGLFRDGERTERETEHRQHTLSRFMLPSRMVGSIQCDSSALLFSSPDE